ncbi:unnamed protein product [Hanseniaspora opuntiae]
MCASTAFDIKNVLIIGAGPTGISAIKAFKKENAFNNIRAYEKRADFGGLWNYVKPLISNETVQEAPLVNSSYRIKPIKTLSEQKYVFDSAVYKNLDTNVPKYLMEYNNYPFPENTPLFPTRDTVLEYLKSFSKGYEEHVSFNTEVLDVVYDKESKKYKAKILEYPFLDQQKATWDPVEYDSVVIASGNYDAPHIPNKEGIKEWFNKYENSIIHSKNFDSPEQFASIQGNILVVGNSASGSDIAFQLATMNNQKIYQTARSESKMPAPKSSNIIVVKDIKRMNYEDKSITFEDGFVLENVEKVIFCTGFLKSFPFLNKETIRPYVDFDNGRNVKVLYNHMIPVELPTLAFIGLPRFVLPTRLSETQAAWLSRVWNNRVDLPPKEIQQQYHEWFVNENNDDATLHDLVFPADVQYSQRLNREIRQARKANRGYFGLEWNGSNIKLRSSIKPLKEGYVKYYQETGKLANTVEELIDAGFFEWPEDATTCVQVPTQVP